MHEARGYERRHRNLKSSKCCNRGALNAAKPTAMRYGGVVVVASVGDVCSNREALAA